MMEIWKQENIQEDYAKFKNILMYLPFLPSENITNYLLNISNEADLIDSENLHNFMVKIRLLIYPICEEVSAFGNDEKKIFFFVWGQQKCKIFKCINIFQLLGNLKSITFFNFIFKSKIKIVYFFSS